MTHNPTSAASNTLPPNAIAVIGMAGRFPGAESVSAFWNNLRDGVESIVTLTDDDLLTAGISEKMLANPSYVRRAALMSGIDEFDADFFGLTPQAARMTDPQHRLFLQSAWHAIEDAGYDPLELDGSVGVFGTSSASGYLLHNLMSHHDPNLIIGQGATFEMVNLSLHNDKDHLATRVAHQLNLRGPALSVQTACSSALVALHLACQSILDGECDMALAGAASIRVPHRVGYWHEPGSMVSGSGHCRPFDVRCDGTVFGSGVGVVLLKALPDAIDDGDRIHAVIRGSALNNDGSTKMTYAAPNAVGQAEAIAEAYAIAEIDPADVGYVETHGTGTPLGDPIEIDGLRQAFAGSEQTRSAPCYIGSVKSNIGHLEAAAGIAGLIKTILCLKHRAIPPTLHFTSPNPELHLENGPFLVRSEYGPWDADGTRRAGVSAFGVGGTNAHVVLEEWPQQPEPVTGQAGPQVLLLSARSPQSLGNSRAALAGALAGAEEPNLADVAHTLRRRRRESIRLAAVATDPRGAVNALRADEDDNVFIGEAVPVDNAANAGDRVVFLFPGQGAQHVGMARGLYDTEPVFARHVDECVAGFDAELDIDLRAAIFDGSARDLERTDRTQPALFTVEYALAKLVESYGVQPAAMAGHSIGEYPAATVAGVFDVATAVTVVSMRARLMHAAPRGVMVAVPLSPAAVAEYLTGDVDLAAVNDPGGCVVAGSEDGIREFTARLQQAGVAARRVRTSHAFHSRLMDAMIPEFTAFLSRVTLREPQLPLLSNITGTWMSAQEATDPATWARQVRATVRFADEMDALLTDPSRVFVEVGPGGILTGSAMRHPTWAATHRAVRLMRHPAQNRADRDAFLLGLGQLWAAGVDVDWTPLHGDHRPRLVSLPGYPFERTRHWVEHNTNAIRAGGSEAGAPSSAETNGRNGAARNGVSQLEETLRRIWGQCLGVGTVDRGANFFDLGGDSLVAISVAMSAAHEGLDLTPQDLYDNPTVAGLARTVTARYMTGGLARQQPGDAEHPPVPPNVEHFLDNGLREAFRWRIPLVLRLRTDVSPADVRAVLTAVTAHHDALRLRLVERGGTWEQQIDEPQEFPELPAETVPAGTEADSPAEQRAVVDILRERSADPGATGPLIACYVRGAADGPGYLALGLHGVAGDGLSRDILLTDIFTAFAQRRAGEQISLQPVTVSWREWSQRCAGLAAHPAVLESRDYWLQTVGKATLRLAGPADGAPGVADLARTPAALSVAETTEIDDARRRLRRPVDEILLAALGRTVAGTVGDGAIAVDLAGPGRSVLKPDIDLRRTVGFFDTVYPVALACGDHDGSARGLLDDVRDTLKAVPHYGIGYGLLRYLYAPTARLLAGAPPADVFFSSIGAIPDLPEAGDAPVQFGPDLALPVREALPGLGHPIELRVYRTGGELHLDWWHDRRRLSETDARALADRYTATLLDLVRQALGETEADSADAELALVDLSSADIGAGGIDG